MIKFVRISAWVLFILLVAISVMVWRSPYGKQEGWQYRLVKHTVLIHVAADSVFRFLGNSGNASCWSVFVHHIVPLNTDSVKDGLPGSRRRCFCNAGETGRQWDETLLQVQPGQKRTISCYDYTGFPMMVDGLATEQLYEALSDSACRLTFTFFVADRKPDVVEAMKLYVGSYTVHRIFRQNMENIKALCEGKTPPYRRQD